MHLRKYKNAFKKCNRQIKSNISIYYRFVRSELDRTITIGFVLSRICATIHATLVCLKVLPLLVQALLFKKRIMEAASLLHELEYYAEEDTDNSGNTIELFHTILLLICNKLMCSL